MGLRKAYNDCKLLPEGINLGFDFCAEHEQGIEDIYRILGIPPQTKPMGLEAVRVNNVDSDKVVLVEDEQIILLVHKDNYYKEKLLRNREGFLRSLISTYYMENRENRDFDAAWDHNGFCIISKNEDVVKMVKSIHENMFKKNLYCILSPSSWIGTGLTLLIADAVSEDIKKEELKADIAFFRLQKKFNKTKIVERIKKAGLRYYALYPSSRIVDENSKFKFKVFLNPAEQHKYKFGWFTIEELKEWTLGRGPVIKD